MRLTLVLTPLILCVALLGCSQAAVQMTSGVAPSVDIMSDPIETTDLQGWLRETKNILASEKFEKNLLKSGKVYSKIWFSSSDKIQTPETVLKSVKLTNSQKPSLWWVPTKLEVAGRAYRDNTQDDGINGNAWALAGFLKYTSSNEAIGVITLGREHLMRYRSADVVEKSCAINSLAHEISHTLSYKPKEFWSFFTDTGEKYGRPKGMMQASYFIGTVAQCTFLQNAKRIGEADLDACVETFGDPTYQTGSPLEDTPFASSACDNFSGTRPVTITGRDTP